MKIHISKLDAAKRQLETAINFFLRSGDPVSIHTLTGAAFQVLEDICAKKDVKSFHKELLENIKPDKRAGVSQRLSAAKNFFKHADNDPEGIIDFNPESTIFYLWDACRMYGILTSSYPPLFGVFTAYFNLKNPELIILSPSQKNDVEHALRELGIDPNNPSTFLRLIPYFEKSHFNFK